MFIKYLLLSLFMISSFANENDTVSNAGPLAKAYERIVYPVFNSGKKCQKVSEKEILSLCQNNSLDPSQTLSILHNQTKESLDNLLEEEIFNDFAAKAHSGARCMAQTTDKILNTPELKSKFIDHFNKTWKDIEPKVNRLRRHHTQLKTKQKRIKDDIAHHFWRFRKKSEKYEKNLEEVNNEITQTLIMISSLFQRLPFSSEPSFANFYWKLGKKTRSDKYLRKKMLKEFKSVNKQSKKSFKRYNNKELFSGKYKIKKRDKKKLYKIFSRDLASEQTLSNTPLIRDGLMCRLNARYKLGPEIARNTIDATLIIAGLFTFGVTSAVGTASKAAVTISRLRKAGKALAIVGLVDVAGQIASSCIDALVLPPDIYVKGQECPLDATIQFEISKKPYADCAFNTLLGSAPFLGKNLKKIIEGTDSVGDARDIISSDDGDEEEK